MSGEEYGKIYKRAWADRNFRALNALVEKGFVTLDPAAVTKTPGPRSTGRAAS